MEITLIIKAFLALVFVLGLLFVTVWGLKYCELKGAKTVFFKKCAASAAWKSSKTTVSTCAIRWFWFAATTRNTCCCSAPDTISCWKAAPPFPIINQRTLKNDKKLSLFIGIIAVAWLFSSGCVWAQTLSIDVADQPTGSATARIFNIIMLITVLSIAPSILVMMTSFTRIVVVFSITRSALSTNSTPPNMVLISLALFLTMFIMAPVFEKSWEEGIKPMIDEKVEIMEGLEKAANPLKEFMVKNTREKDLLLFSDISQEKTADTIEETPLKVAVPAFMISELRRAFEIGFLIFIPFLIIDMVIASILMSMGMMMLPPSVLSMPFKIIFFVLIDGWYLLAGSLVQSFK